MAKVFYNVEMARAIRKVKKPVKDLKIQIKLMPDWVALCIFEENVMQYDIDKRADILSYLVLCKNVIESYGTRCELEGIRYAKKQNGVS
jgi:hypothetical protein